VAVSTARTSHRGCDGEFDFGCPEWVFWLELIVWLGPETKPWLKGRRGGVDSPVGIGVAAKEELLATNDLNEEGVIKWSEHGIALERKAGRQGQTDHGRKGYQRSEGGQRGYWHWRTIWRRVGVS